MTSINHMWITFLYVYLLTDNTPLRKENRNKKIGIENRKENRNKTKYTRIRCLFIHGNNFSIVEF